MRFKVLAPEAGLFPPKTESEMLGAIDAIVVPLSAKTDEDVRSAGADADAILSCYVPITRRCIEGLERCVVITRYGIGVDNIDVEAATDHGIIVSNVPDFCIDEVADTAMAMILALERGIVVLDRNVKSGKWSRAGAGPFHSLRKQVLGLVGFGNIARAVALRAASFGFRLVAHDPYVKREDVNCFPVSLLSLEDVLRQADIVSLHTPLTRETRHLIGEKELRTMKPTAYLVNTSRGGVVDQTALYRALAEGWIAGAALDVFEKEPLAPDHPLTRLPNVVLTPHFASYTDEAFEQLRRKVAQNTIDALCGRVPRYVVNPAVLEKARMRQR